MKRMSLPKMSKEESRKVSKWLSEHPLPPMSWGPKRKRFRVRADQDNLSLGVGSVNGTLPNQEIIELELSAIAEGAQFFPVGVPAISEQKAAILIGGQGAPVTVRKHDDGQLEQLDGFHCTTALRELGRSSVSAIVISGLTDWEADFRRLVGHLGPHLKALDKALVLAQLLRLRAQKVSQDETPSGGTQPSEKYLRKLEKELPFSKDQLSRSSKIARILPATQQKIRELRLDDNQAALLKIAEAGETLDLQIAKAMELHERPKKRRSGGPKCTSTAVADTTDTAGTRDTTDESASELPDIPLFLRRDRPEVSYDQLDVEWSRCDLRGLLLAAAPEDRQRFVNECLMPTLFAAATVVAEERRDDC